MTGHNVFISYKYNDSNVKRIGLNYTTARDYVDVLQNKFCLSRKIYDRSEHDGEDLSNLNEDTIRSILSDKIFYTSVTIVLISPGMNNGKPENKQWIPWEISYSLKETRRSSGKSGINGIVAIVLPDRSGSYDYIIEEAGCHRIIKSDNLFEIISKNRYNRKNVQGTRCRCGCITYDDNSSYIILTRWNDFISNPNLYIDKAIKNRNEHDQFIITKSL